MEREIMTLLMESVIAAPVITALVEVFKRAVGIGGEDDDRVRFIPLIAVIIGIIIGVIIVEKSVAGAAAGMIMGLASTGIFEFRKSTILNK